MIQAPVVSNPEYTCIDCTPEGVLQLLSADGNMKEDVSLPSASHLKDLEKQLRSILEEGKKEALVRIQKWGDIEQMIAVREGADI